ncbi:MAG: hypothetical protein WAV20_06165 [Blastocatellia bacterium]
MLNRIKSMPVALLPMAGFILLVAASASAQQQKQPDKRRPAQTASGETKPMTDPPIACNLVGLSAAERSRQQQLHELLFSRTTGVRELSNGYAVSLPGTKENILAVAEFISLERVCCSFFRFKLEAGNQDEPLLLSITGGKGVKEFLKSAFKLK